MAFPRLVQQGLFDWIEANLAAGQPAPSDAEIMDRYGLASVDRARSLLADLADAKRISIQWADGGRIVTLGRAAPSSFTPARLVAPTVVRREADGSRVQVHPETVLADPRHIRRAQPQNRIENEIVSPARPVEVGAASEGEQPAAEQARVKPAPPITSGGAQRVEEKPAPLTQQGAATPGNSKERPAGNVAKQHVGPAPDRADSPHPKPLAKRLPTAPARPLPAPRVAPIASKAERRQLNLHFPPDAFARLEAAKRDDESAAAAARRILVEALGAPEPTNVVAFEPGKKPFISAAMIRAAREAGQPLDIFVTAMLARGFNAWRVEQGLGVAA